MVNKTRPTIASSGRDYSSGSRKVITCPSASAPPLIQNVRGKMKKEEKYIVHSFKEILNTITPNYTWGISAIVLPLLLLASPVVLFSTEEPWEQKLTYLSMFILVPVVLYLQSLMISIICYWGSKVRLFVHLKKRPNCQVPHDS